MDSIQEPFRNNKIEEDNWSFLIGSLCDQEVEIQIITRQNVDGIFEKRDLPPYKIPFQIGLAKSVEICKYIDGKHNGLEIHDRYILQIRNSGYKGLHIGLSLSNINGKDISVTIYQPDSARKVFNSFNNIWQNCIKQKEWKKG